VFKTMVFHALAIRHRTDEDRRSGTARCRGAALLDAARAYGERNGWIRTGARLKFPIESC
jgi:cytosine/adenosine deaminase-related metal-dependent hydrolase